MLDKAFILGCTGMTKSKMNVQEKMVSRAVKGNLHQKIWTATKTGPRCGQRVGPGPHTLLWAGVGLMCLILVFSDVQLALAISDRLQMLKGTFLT